MNIVFMGTPDFAVPSLQAIARSRHRLAGVFSQPDRPKGRSREPAPPAVKVAALDAGAPVFQPDNVNAPDAVQQLRALAPDAIVVVAFGQILSRQVLDIPQLGALNVHGSLLPRHRGAAPIAAAILAGDEETGVTIQLMAEEMDAGDVLTQARTPIRHTDTAGTLHDRLATLSCEPLLAALDGLERGAITPRPQDHSQATYTGKLAKADGVIDWSRPATYLGRFVRAMTPWPGAATQLSRAERRKPIRVLLRQAAPSATRVPNAAEPGQVVRADERGVLVACGQGALNVLEIQQAGKRALAVEEFLRGQPVQPGDRFG